MITTAAGSGGGGGCIEIDPRARAGEERRRRKEKSEKHIQFRVSVLELYMIDLAKEFILLFLEGGFGRV